MTFSKNRILVAEDNLVLGQVLKTNLVRAGFDVHWEKNGRDAFMALKGGEYDLFVTDLEMPFCNGDTVCIRVRQELGLTELPIIMCSAKGLEFDVSAMIERCGLSKFLFKPFSMVELLELASKLTNSTNLMSACVSAD